MISYFVRRYVKGVKGYGTKDLLKMDEAPQDFPALVEPFDQVNTSYSLVKKVFVDLAKMLEHIVGEPVKAFAAESVSVKQEVNVEQVPTDQLKTLLADMISNPKSSEDFASDLETVYKEVMSRAETQGFAAPAGDNSQGLINKHSILGFTVGAVGAGVVVNQMKNKEIDELKALIEKQSETVTQLTETVKRSEHERKKSSRFGNGETKDDASKNGYGQ